MAVAKRGLGKGLGALIGGEAEMGGGEIQSAVIEVDINRVEPNRDQPRKYFDTEALEELAASIREYGVIQPLIVKEEDGDYSIVAGERRWRAARLAKLRTVPVIVKEYTDLETLQVALIENIQRADLNPLEEAECYKRLSEEFSFTHEQIAEKIGKTRTYVTNSLRLLGLDPRVLSFVADGRLSAGAGRALLGLPDGEAQFVMAENIIDEGWNVRKVEDSVRDYGKSRGVERAERPKRKPAYLGLEDELSSVMKAPVHIKEGINQSGRIEIEYYSPEELDRLLLLLRNL